MRFASKYDYWLDPQELLTAMRMARDVEELYGGARTGNGGMFRNQHMGKPNGAMVRVHANRQNQGRAETTVGNRTGAAEKGQSGGIGGSGVGQPRNVKDLPCAEYVKRKEEGRCFRCGGPFGPGHRCPERSLRMLILAEDEEEESETELNQVQMELSAFSAGGLTQPKTMKLHGWIGEKQVLILIDCGASHNFISKELVGNLGLPVVDTLPYMVSLGDGQKKTRGCCEEVVIRMEERFHLFELGGVDVILGVEWLAKLEVTLNWRELTMAFDQEGRKVTIQGDPTLARRLVEPGALLKNDRGGSLDAGLGTRVDGKR